MTVEKKLDWVDCLKGMGILSVAAGHIFSDKYVHLVFLFHMPLFFFLAGYLYRPRSDLLSYFKAKARHLLMPYAAFLVLIYPFQMYQALHAPDAVISAKAILKLLCMPIFGGTALTGYCAVFWFVTCLFLTQQVVNVLYARFAEKTVLMAMIGFSVLAYANSLFLPQLAVPLAANIVFAAAPLFVLGHLARQGRLSIPLWIAIPAAAGIVALDLTGYGVNLDMKHAVYGVPLLSLAGSLACIFVLMGLARQAVRFSALSSALQTLGAASLVIMFLHEPIQMLMARYGINIELVRFVAAVALSYGAYVLLGRWSWTRQVFLGG